MYSTATRIDKTVSAGAFSPVVDPFQNFFNEELFFHSAELVKRIRLGETGSMEVLYAMLRTWVRCQLVRKVDRHLVDDKFHDVVVTVLEAISSGTMQNPERLLGFVSTVTRRHVAAHIRANIKRRRCTPFNEYDFPGTPETCPEALILRREAAERLVTLLSVLRPRDRNLLIRFYLDEQPPARICKEMGLTPTQFRLYKSRALSRCAASARPSVSDTQLISISCGQSKLAGAFSERALPG